MLFTDSVQVLSFALIMELIDVDLQFSSVLRCAWLPDQCDVGRRNLTNQAWIDLELLLHRHARALSIKVRHGLLIFYVIVRIY